jgi:hypothetical protein
MVGSKIQIIHPDVVAGPGEGLCSHVAGLFGAAPHDRGDVLPRVLGPFGAIGREILPDGREEFLLDLAVFQAGRQETLFQPLLAGAVQEQVVKIV